MISEITWLILVVWVALLAFGRREQIIGAFGSFVGIFFGLILMSGATLWLGLILIFLNIYILYTVIMRSEK